VPDADLLARLLSRCERQPNGCLYWTGPTDKYGYGRTTVDSQQWLAHRLIWELIHGAIPSGLHCLHSCDRPPCCEVSHLDVGTHRENMEQMVAKGRQARGSAHGNARLTAFQVWQIRRIIALGRFSNAEIAQIFGVSSALIHAIRERRSWTWLRENTLVPIIDLVPPLTFRRRTLANTERYSQ
jgi:hypothetical protein